MLHTFSNSLANRLSNFPVDGDVRRAIYEQRVKLAGIELPAGLDAEMRRQVEQAIASSFVAGFRLIMFTSAVLALGGAMSSWLLIDAKKGKSHRKVKSSVHFLFSVFRWWICG